MHGPINVKHSVKYLGAQNPNFISAIFRTLNSPFQYIESSFRKMVGNTSQSIPFHHSDTIISLKLIIAMKFAFRCTDLFTWKIISDVSQIFSASVNAG
jgi:hypothetical protein